MLRSTHVGIGDRIWIYRKHMHMDLSALSMKTGIPIDILDDFENGSVDPTEDEIDMITEALGINEANFYYCNNIVATIDIDDEIYVVPSNRDKARLMMDLANNLNHLSVEDLVEIRRILRRATNR